MKFWVVLLALFLAYLGYEQHDVAAREAPSVQHKVGDAETLQNTALKRAFEQRQSKLQVQGEGRVTKLLKDDNEGSRHQRFILQVNPQQTILIAHNIDLAPRIDSLAEGDIVTFSGQYEWNNKGGVVHWTHHDPQGRHPGGWLKHHGKTYE
ncbi:MAG: DUF3465 domain-containing protein [Methylophilaceae bacterium]|nr:DUF3465 domain-containing protein [Methylophilaceae bacterium]